MINKWVKKPVVLDAIQWNGDNIKEIETFSGFTNLDFLEVGGYIVKEENGTFQAYSRSAFYTTYKRHLVWEENL